MSKPKEQEKLSNKVYSKATESKEQRTKIQEESDSDWGIFERTRNDWNDCGRTRRNEGEEYITVRKTKSKNKNKQLLKTATCKSKWQIIFISYDNNYLIHIKLSCPN